MSWGSGLGATTDLVLGLAQTRTGGSTPLLTAAEFHCCTIINPHTWASNNTLQQCVLVQCLVVMQGGGAGPQIWVWV